MSDDDTSKAGDSMEDRKAAGRADLFWPVVGVVLLALQVGTASAGGDGDDFGRHGIGNGVLGHLVPKICRQNGLSEKIQAWCDSIAGVRGRDRFKAITQAHLRRTNQRPWADLKVDRVQPDRVDLNARDSWDEDGFPHIFYFRLEDAETGEVLAGPVTTREPVASLHLNGRWSQSVRAVVVVEDDERALDEADVPLDLPANCGSNTKINCFPQGDDPQITTCYPTALTFTTDDLLDAAQQCNANITTSTPVVFSASGAAGGRGADVWPLDGDPGGEGGLAALGTTLAALDQAYPSSSYCYGIGQAGGHTDTNDGAGGASTVLRTCDNVSQTETTGVLLIAGGGGGGAATAGGSGGDGGVAYSGTAGPCPGSCILDTVPAGQHGQGEAPGNGGSSGDGGAGGGCSGGNGNEGVGGAGGYVTGFGTAYWVQGDPQVGINPNTGINAGQGGECGGASGGGGYGGGGGGGGGGDAAVGGGSDAAHATLSNIGSPQWSGGGGGYGGGGGGGSYAAQSTLSNIDSSQWSRSAGGGWIYILFGPQP